MLCRVDQTKSTSHRALYFMCYKQQIKAQALAALLHFTAATIKEENCISALFRVPLSNGDAN